MRGKRKIRIGLWLSAGLGMLCLLGGCRREEESRSITGRVAVEGGAAGGVTVELYNVPTHDAGSVWTTTAQHPSVGIPYSLNQIFDFRMVRSSLWVDSTNTDAEGKFEFPDVPAAEFVVVVRKTGYGWSRPIRADARNGSADLGSTTLRPEHVILAGTAITGEERWLSGHHYVVANNANPTINAGAKLTIEPGAVVRMPSVCEFRVRGTLECLGTADDPIIFTSSEVVNPLAANGWQYIYFSTTADPPLFRYCTFSYTAQAILSDRPGGRVENCYFAQVLTEGVGLTGSGAAEDSVVVTGNVFNHIAVGLRIENATGSGLNIARNAFYLNLAHGAFLKQITGGSVYCNWFYSCGRADTLTSGLKTGGMYLQSVQETHISRNEFVSCQYGLVLGSAVRVTTLVDYNRFFRGFRGIYVGTTTELPVASLPNITNNCFEGVDNVALYHDACLVNTQSVDVTNNFWGTTSDAGVRQEIRDCEEDDDCPCANYSPFLTACPSGETGLCP